MINKEDINIEVQEIRQHPERIWSSKDKELAAGVFAEIKKEYPEAALCDAWWTSWIALNESQREELREMLEEIRENQQTELDRLQRAMGQLLVTEKEKLESWLDRKIREKEALYIGRDYSKTIQSCDTEVTYYQLYNGIEKAAEILGKKIQLKERPEGKVEKRFQYGNYEIVQLRDSCDDRIL